MRAVRMLLPKSPRLALLLVVALLAFIPGISPLSAQELFFEIPFDDSDLPGWEVTGQVDVEGGVLYVSDDSSVHRGGEWGDLKMTIAMQLRGEGPAVISYRDTASGGYHLVVFHQAVVFLREGEDGQSRELAATGDLTLSQEQFELTIRAFGGIHEIYINGAPVLTIIDPEPLAPGGLTLGASGATTALFDHLILVAEPAPQAQPLEVRLDSVRPSDGRPGETLEIRFVGSGFVADADEYAVGIEGVEILDVRWISEDEVRADVFVPEAAEPGRRSTGVGVRVGDEWWGDELEAGFLVVVGAEPDVPVVPTPHLDVREAEPGPEPSQLLTDGAWAVVAALMSGAGFAVGRWLSRSNKGAWTEQAKLRWHIEAERELPEPQRACQWACRGKADADLFDRWAVTRLTLKPLPVRGEATAPETVVMGKPLEALNDLTSLVSLLQREVSLRQHLSPLVDSLVSAVMEWAQNGRSPAAFRITAQLKAPINVEFGLHHCHVRHGELTWGEKPLVRWTGKVKQQAGESLAVVLGPRAGETDFEDRIRSEIEDCLIDLVKIARLKA